MGVERAACGQIGGQLLPQQQHQCILVLGALARELGKAADAAVVKYRHEVSLFDAFGMASAKAAQPAEVRLDVSSGLLPKLQPGVPYYLPAHYAH